MKKILYMLLCLFLLVGCTHQTGENTGSSSRVTTKKIDECDIEYDSDKLILDELTKIPYYKTDFIPFELKNEEVLKEISINISDLALRNEQYHEINYEAECFKYNAYFLLKENKTFEEILVNFFGETISGYYRIRFNDSGFFNFNQYSVYHSSFEKALFTDDLSNGSEIVMSFTDGDSTSHIIFIRQGNYLIEKEE